VVLKVAAADVQHLSERAVPDHPGRLLKSRGFAQVKADNMDDTGLLGRPAHLFRLARRTGEGLLAENMLAGADGRKGDLAMEVGGSGDHHEIHVWTPHRLLPAHLRLLEIQSGGGLAGALLLDLAHNQAAQPWQLREEERKDPPGGVVRPGDEASSHEREPNLRAHGERICASCARRPQLWRDEEASAFARKAAARVRSSKSPSSIRLPPRSA